MGALGILVGCITPIGLTKHVSDKRPETDADILSRSTELSYDFATGARRPGRRYHHDLVGHMAECCLLYTSPSPRDGLLSRMPSSA